MIKFPSGLQIPFDGTDWREVIEDLPSGDLLHLTYGSSYPPGTGTFHGLGVIVIAQGELIRRLYEARRDDREGG